jgi:predicted exporter
VRALNEQAVLEALEALAPALEARIAQGTLGEFQSAARWLPSVATQQKRQSILPPGEVLRARLKQAGTGLPFRANLFEPFIKDIEQARRRAPLTLLSLEGNVLAERVRALLAMTPDGWTAPVLLRGVTDPQPLEALAGDRHGARVVFLDVKKESARVMENYRNRALEVCALGFLAILFVLTIGLRSPIHALRIALTPLAAVLVTVACLTWLGQGLTLFHVIALLLIVGLGIDYSLFFDRLSNDAAEWQTTFPAVVLCWLTTLAVFGSLTLSQAAVLKAIGLTVAIGVTFCLVFAAVWRREGTHDQTN